MRTFATLICTMGRPDELRRALSALGNCDPKPAEVVVSDDSAIGDRRSLEVCQSFPHVRYQVGPRQGLAANRNACMATVAAEHIHFIDDDVVVPSGFYGKAYRALETQDRPIILTGFEWNHLEGSHPSVVRVEPPRVAFWAHMQLAGKRAANCVVMNAAIFPRALFHAVQFDELFKYGYEESDITLQAIRAGYPLIYDPALHVDHFPSPTNRDRYRGWVIRSQVYAGLKRQWTFKRSGFRTLAFTLVAIPRLLLYVGRRYGVSAVPNSATQTMHGVRHFLRLCYTGGADGANRSS